MLKLLKKTAPKAICVQNMSEGRRWHEQHQAIHSSHRSAEMINIEGLVSSLMLSGIIHVWRSMNQTISTPILAMRFPIKHQQTACHWLTTSTCASAPSRRCTSLHLVPTTCGTRTSSLLARCLGSLLQTKTNLWHEVPDASQTCFSTANLEASIWRHQELYAN